jgi:hypothetical protein
MYRLITFGGLSLVGADERIAAAANQRSRLALLAVLVLDATVVASDVRGFDDAIARGESASWRYTR